MNGKSPSTKLFLSLTIGYLASVLIGSWLLGYLDPTGTPIAPNEWGDVLAGVFSPLAFLWLIYASLSQRAELQLQRIELRLQREELALNNATQDAQREEMHRQVEAMVAQSRLLEAQANGRYEPAFVAISGRFDAENPGAVMVELQNQNAGISNVTFSSNVTPTATRPTPSASYRRHSGNAVGHIPAGGCVTLTIDQTGNGEGGPEFTIGFDRLDGFHCVRDFRLSDGCSRIERIHPLWEHKPLTGPAGISATGHPE